MLAKGRAKAIEQSESSVRQIEEHLETLETEPGDEARAHHVTEVIGWIAEVRSNLRHMGVRTGREWKQHVDEWERRLNRVR
jgi:hypothetical protein